MTAWAEVEADVAMAEADRPSRDRQATLTVLKASRLVPVASSQYVASFAVPGGATVCAEFRPLRPNLWFEQGHAEVLGQAGMVLEERSASSGRTSGLNRSTAFGERAAFKLAAPDPSRVRAALDMLGLAGPLRLDPAVIDRWVAALRTVFPNLRRFDAPDPDFDATEIDYKRERAARLRDGLATARSGTEAAESVRRAFGRSDLIDWRALDRLRGGWDKATFGEALLDVSKGGGGLAAAVGRAVAAWMAGAPDAQRDHARQVAGAVAMLLHSREAVMFRRIPLDSLHREATGLPFPPPDDPTEDFSREVAFARQVFDAFADRGLAPRNLLDVQGALWVVANPDKFGIPNVLPETPPKEPLVPEPLNTILYGPPGTGKTYATMLEAVGICDGRAQAAALDHGGLRLRHDALREAGRIAFVTFHQSFSYEDFVEGLRPETEATEGGDGPGQAGFRLVACKGVLREMAELAAKGRSAAPADAGADIDQRRVFKMSLGRAHDEDEAYLFEECTADKDGHVLMGWGGKVDWRAARFDTFDGILQGWQEVEPGATGYNMNVKAIWSLRNDMRVGDVVVVSNGNSAFRAVGVVAGPYEFDDRGGEDHYHHKRRVRWTWVEPVGLPVSTIMGGQFSQQSIYRITKAKLKLDVLAAYLAERAEPEHLPHVLVIDEINRANVSKVFGELITLLEEDKRAGAPNAVTVRLPYSGDAFSLPANLHLLGTMNTADRSIALLDTALRRRFAFVEMPPQPDLLDPARVGLIGGLDLAALLTRLNERIEYLFDRDHLIGHAFLMGARTRADVDVVMRRKVIPLLAEYFHEDWERIVAVLGGHGKQGFIERTALPVPPGLDAEGETRWRYIVRDAFPEDAYAGLQP